MLMFKEVFVAPRQEKLNQLNAKRGMLDSYEEPVEEIDPQFKNLIKEVKDVNEIKIKKKKKRKKGDNKSVITLLQRQSQLQKSPGSEKKKGEPDSPTKSMSKSVVIKQKHEKKEEKSFFES